MIELALAEIAFDFWQDAGGFGSDFEEAVALNLPLGIKKISHLTLQSVCKWLVEEGIALEGLDSLPERDLRACLVTYGEPRNYVFLDETDSAADQLFSLAHEVAHFLLDYQQPRERAEQHLGKEILQVLDGKKELSLEQRLSGWLNDVKLKPHRHFMERSSQGDILSSEILQIESRADKLALELLAPEEKAVDIVRTAIVGKDKYRLRTNAAQIALMSQFYLAKNIAKPYAERLVAAVGGHQKVSEWLES